MSLIKRKECKAKADYRVVTCPNCGARIEIKTMERRYMFSLLFLVVIFALIVYFNRNITTTSSTSLSSSQPKSTGVIEKKDEAEKVEAEAPEKAKAETEAQTKVEALKAKVATQGAEAEQAKLAIMQKVNQSWIRPSSTSVGSRCTIRVRVMSDGR